MPDETVPTPEPGEATYMGESVTILRTAPHDHVVIRYVDRNGTPRGRAKTVPASEVTTPDPAERPGEPGDDPGDPRFTLGLTLDVAQVIAQHDYPELNGGQVIELQLHLFHLLHGDPAGRCAGGVA